MYAIRSYYDLKVCLDMSLALIEFDNKALDTISEKSTEDVTFTLSYNFV